MRTFTEINEDLILLGFDYSYDYHFAEDGIQIKSWDVNIHRNDYEFVGSAATFEEALVQALKLMNFYTASGY